MLRRPCCCSYMQTPICQKERLQPFRPAAEMNLHRFPIFSHADARTSLRDLISADSPQGHSCWPQVPDTIAAWHLQVALCDPNVMGGCFELRFHEEDDSWTLQLWSVLASNSQRIIVYIHSHRGYIIFRLISIIYWYLLYRYFAHTLTLGPGKWGYPSQTRCFASQHPCSAAQDPLSLCPHPSIGCALPHTPPMLSSKWNRWNTMKYHLWTTGRWQRLRV